ncbi:MAG: GNAT family N-acetyltransferase [Kiritimatiellales bacterium]|nr:GNAT family N-acetyltransferase [Kiritimatiellales bacterium]
MTKLSGSLDIRVVSPSEDSAWDSLVTRSPTGNRFLRSDCLRMLEATDSVGIRFKRLGAFNDRGELRGGWPLPVQRRLGMRASTYFEFFYAGPMLVPELETGSVHIARERLEILHGLAKKHGEHVHLIEAEGHPHFYDARGVHYAGWQVQAAYTHIWDFESPNYVFSRMNRERRRLIRRAAESYEFGPLPHKTAADEFIPIYRKLMWKFNWAPSPQWDRDFKNRIAWLLEHDAAGIYGARDSRGKLQAAVIVLLSHDDRTLYLWRCGYNESLRGHSVIPALYWNACRYWHERWGMPVQVNMGGSPHYTLSQFKDYLGAEAVAHCRLVWRKPGPQCHALRGARAFSDAVRRGLIAVRRGVTNTK